MYDKLGRGKTHSLENLTQDLRINYPETEKLKYLLVDSRKPDERDGFHPPFPQQPMKKGLIDDDY